MAVTIGDVSFGCCGAEARKLEASELPATTQPNKASAKMERIIVQLLTRWEGD